MSKLNCLITSIVIVYAVALNLFSYFFMWTTNNVKKIIEVHLPNIQVYKI